MAKNRVYVGELTRHQFTPEDLSPEAFKLYEEGEEVIYTDSEGNFYEADDETRAFAWLIGENLEEVEEYLLWALEELQEEG